MFPWKDQHLLPTLQDMQQVLEPVLLQVPEPVPLTQLEDLSMMVVSTCSVLLIPTLESLNSTALRIRQHQSTLLNSGSNGTNRTSLDGEQLPVQAMLLRQIHQPDGYQPMPWNAL